MAIMQFLFDVSFAIGIVGLFLVLFFSLFDRFPRQRKMISIGIIAIIVGGISCFILFIIAPL